MGAGGGSFRAQTWQLQRPWGENRFGIFMQHKEDPEVQNKRRKWWERGSEMGGDRLCVTLQTAPV